MLAYVFWHRPGPVAGGAAYEKDLLRFHHSLRESPPSGFRGSRPFAPAAPPWPTHRGDPVYEDWYLVDGWSALGILEEAAVAHGHASLHDAIARRAEWGAGAVYRLLEGRPELAQTRSCAWVTAVSGHSPPALADLLADGIDAARDSLWRRSLTLGPGPEYALLSARTSDRTPDRGLSPGRLPDGWRAEIRAKEELEHG